MTGSFGKGLGRVSLDEEQVIQVLIEKNRAKKEKRNSMLRKKCRNKFKAQASLVGAQEGSEKDRIGEARKTWELGKQFVLTIEDKSEVVVYLAKFGKAKKRGLQQTRRNKYKGRS